MSYYNIPGYEYLNKLPDNELAIDIYQGLQAKHFNTDEFEFIPADSLKDWVSSNIVKNSIDMIVDLIQIGSVQVDFDNTQLNDYWNELMDEGINLNLENMVRDKKVYGSGYLQLAVEDELDTAKEDYGIHVYNVNPNTVFAKYDYNQPQRGANKYTLKFEKKEEKKSITYCLLVSYMPGKIEYEAFEIRGDKSKQINPVEYFEEFFSEDLTYKKEGLKIYYETELDYNALTHFNNPARYGEFYGQSDINLQVVSKLNLIERMYNLADFHSTDKAKPKTQLSKATGQLLKNAIDKRSGDYDVVDQYPVSFKGEVASAKSRKSYEMSRVYQTMNDQLTYFVSDGQGDNKYIVNPSQLTDLYELIDRAKSELYSDMYISEVLVNPELASGNLSGVALKRLMSRTNEHVTNQRKQIEGRLKQFAYTTLQLAKKSGVNTNIPDVTDLPQITWSEISFETIEETALKYNTALQIKNTDELKNIAVSDLTGIEKEVVEGMQAPLPMRERMNQQLSQNGGNIN